MSVLEAAPTKNDAGLSAYSEGRPLMLLTDFPADAGGGGAVILRSLLGSEDWRKILWASPSPPKGVAPEGSITLASGSAAKGSRSLFADSTRHAAALADEVLALARDRGVTALWIVMHGAMVHVAARLVRDGSLPVHLTIHDDPVYASTLRARRQMVLAPWVARDLTRAMKGAASIDVVGAGMADYYRRRLGVESTIVHRGVTTPVMPSPEYDRSRGLRVAALGNVYEYKALARMAGAVEIASKRLNVPGCAVVMGQNPGARLKAEMAGRLEVEITGHVAEPAAIEHLRGCFALYLNYPFGPFGAVLRRTSFPTKLSTYVMAARPLIVHSPADGSVAPLWSDEPGYAYKWSRAGSEEGAEVLARMWADPGSLASQHESADRVRLRYYDPSRNRPALLGILNALAKGG
jgi:hypothetical protein